MLNKYQYKILQLPMLRLDNQMKDSRAVLLSQEKVEWMRHGAQIPMMLELLLFQELKVLVKYSNKNMLVGTEH